MSVVNMLKYSNAAFIHAGLTTRYRTKNLYKTTFVLSRHEIYSLWRGLKITGI